MPPPTSADWEAVDTSTVTKLESVVVVTTEYAVLVEVVGVPFEVVVVPSLQVLTVVGVVVVVVVTGVVAVETVVTGVVVVTVVVLSIVTVLPLLVAASESTDVTTGVPYVSLDEVTVAPEDELEVTIGVPGAVLTTVGEEDTGATPPLLTVVKMLVAVKVEEYPPAAPDVVPPVELYPPPDIFAVTPEALVTQTLLPEVTPQLEA